MAGGAIRVADTTATTGSFKSLQVGGGNFGCAEFTNIQIGKLANPESDSEITHIVTSLEVSHSVSIEGPIYGFKLANGSVLAYYTD